MKTRKEQMAGCTNFAGDDSEYQDWYGVAGRSRDSEIWEECNFQVALEMLGGESENVRVERYDHWACGWIEEIYVRLDTEEFIIACKIEKSLSDYPILDADKFSEMECEAANDVWRDCFTPPERIEYIREHQSEFNFGSFSELRSVIRGEYFNGYASELL
jgi:hypothetical protein